MLVTVVIAARFAPLNVADLVVLTGLLGAALTTILAAVVVGEASGLPLFATGAGAGVGCGARLAGLPLDGCTVADSVTGVFAGWEVPVTKSS